ncbi:hypothetical protein WJX72_008612 [[Myrmecia] bisecta]|uniref:Class I SAM-dependent methyltransferase n=1 Tax=[Myrmecia] bisecta TaxID=41462 RepID=A0AAW1PLK9_9CHLO
MVSFTTDWFSHNIETWQRVFTSVGWLGTEKDLRALEVGTWEGRSACWLLQHVCRSPGSKLVCIDNWAGAQQYGAAGKIYGLDSSIQSGHAVEERFDSNVQVLQAEGRVDKMKMESMKALATLIIAEGDPFHVVYIDCSHNPKDLIADAVMSWPLVRAGGLLIFDDYAWEDVVTLEEGQSPKHAIDAFLMLFSQELIVLVQSYQLVVQKMGPTHRAPHPGIAVASSDAGLGT